VLYDDRVAVGCLSVLFFPIVPLLLLWGFERQKIRRDPDERSSDRGGVFDPYWWP
jgi:hypothetical protein